MHILESTLCTKIHGGIQWLDGGVLGASIGAGIGVTAFGFLITSRSE